MYLPSKVNFQILVEDKANVLGGSIDSPMIMKWAKVNPWCMMKYGELENGKFTLEGVRREYPILRIDVAVMSLEAVSRS
jgi:hypothetical protein